MVDSRLFMSIKVNDLNGIRPEVDLLLNELLHHPEDKVSEVVDDRLVKYEEIRTERISSGHRIRVFPDGSAYRKCITRSGHVEWMMVGA